VFGEVAPAGFRPVHAEEAEVRWPEHEGRLFAKKFTFDDYRCEWQFSVDGLNVRGGWNEPSQLVPHGSMRLTQRKSTGYSSRGTGFFEEGFHHLDDFYVGHPLPQPLSIVHGRRKNLHALCHVTRVAWDDPLEDVSLTRFIRDRGEAIRRIVREEELDSPRYGPYPGPEYIPARSVSLAGYIGLSSLLLLASAILLTQLFRRRNLAFAAVLVGITLYVAVLDRMALGAHLSRLTNADAPLPARLVACSQSGETFFYRSTAIRELEALLKEEATPPALRESANRKLNILIRRKANWNR
jgi:hypothetical protein